MLRYDYAMYSASYLHNIMMATPGREPDGRAGAEMSLRAYVYVQYVNNMHIFDLCMFVYLCIRACVYVCLFVRMHVFVHAMHVCRHACMYVCNESMYVSIQQRTAIRDAFHMKPDR